MKRFLLYFCFGLQSFLWANPIDNTPIAKFSELIFDDNVHWTMELYLPFNEDGNNADSVILTVSNSEAKIRTEYPDGVLIGIITSDNLSNPLTINQAGDSIVICTYSSVYGSQVRSDNLIFGDFPGASVGQPVSGYSIMRNFLEYDHNDITIDCLTRFPSLGTLNDTTGLGGTMRGALYDNTNSLITNLVPFPAGYWYFQLEMPLNLHSDGTFTTQIFPTLYTPGLLFVKIGYFPTFQGTVAIEPFELKDIHPDTVVVQDIHLISDCPYCGTNDAVESNDFPRNTELTLINYPNPFNAATNFFVKLPDSMKEKEGNISIYNNIGQLVREIPFKQGGSTRWDGRDMNGKAMSSGIFCYRLNIAGQTLKTGSVVLLK